MREPLILKPVDWNKILEEEAIDKKLHPEKYAQKEREARFEDFR